MSIDIKPYDNPKWNKMVIKRSIGKGWMGEVFVVECDGLYVAKICKITPAMLKPITGETWRELYFYTKIASKYKKELILYTIDYSIINTCNELNVKNSDGQKQQFKHPMSDNNTFFKNIPSKYKKLQRKLMESPYCLISIQPLIKSHMMKLYFDEMQNYVSPIKLAKPTKKICWMLKSDFVNKRLYFTKRDFYGWYIDLMKQIALLHKIGFSHNDIHIGNILVLDAPVGCLTRRATLIDYGLVNCKKWRKYSIDNDIASLFFISRIDNHGREHKRLNAIYGDKKYPIGNAHYFNDIKKFMKSPICKHILHMCENISTKFKNEIAFHLAEMLMPEAMKLLESGTNYASQMSWTEMWLIDFEDVLMILEYGFKPNALPSLIEHFQQRLSTM